jgi:hypothetical protein
VNAVTFEHEHKTLDAFEIVAEIIAGRPVRLVHCRIKGPLDLCAALAGSGEAAGDSKRRRFTIRQDLNFNACIFEEDVSFSGPWEDTDSLRVSFEGDVLFNMSLFCGQARFIGATFGKAAGFDGCTFQRVCAFREAIFCGRTLFRTVMFEGYVLFNEAMFREDARFINTCFAKGANFTAAYFGQKADFQGVYAHGKTVPQIERVRFGHRGYGDDLYFWRFMKQVSQDAGLYRDAGECFYKEQCAHLWMRFRGTDYRRRSAWGKALRWLAGVRLLPELALGRLLFGYGERPIRVLGAAAIIILACGLFYASPLAKFSIATDPERSGLRPLEGLFYSTTTFTTLGLGDIAPGADSPLTQIVTMGEAFCGAFLIALFVVCFWKRFSRG